MNTGTANEHNTTLVNIRGTAPNSVSGEQGSWDSEERETKPPVSPDPIQPNMPAKKPIEDEDKQRPHQWPWRFSAVSIVMWLAVCAVLGQSASTPAKSEAAKDSTEANAEEPKKDVDDKEKPQKEDTPPPQPRGTAINSVWHLDLKTMEITPADHAYSSANKRNIPFDVPFLLVLDSTKHIKAAHLGVNKVDPKKYTYRKLNSRKPLEACDSCLFSCVSNYMRTPEMDGNVVLVVPSLDANGLYEICIQIDDEPLPAEGVRQVAQVTAEHLRSLAEADMVSYWNSQGSKKVVDSLQVGQLKSKIEEELERRYKRISVTFAENPLAAADSPFQTALRKQNDSSFRLKLDLTAGTVNLQNGVDSTQLARFMGNQGGYENLWGTYRAGVDTTTLKEAENVTLKDLNDLSTRRMNLRVNRDSLMMWGTRIQSASPDFTTQRRTIDSSIAFIERLERKAGRYLDASRDVEKRIEQLVEVVAKNAGRTIRLSANTAADFQTRASWYFAPDVGFVFIPDWFGMGKGRPAQFTSYYGTQFHLLPINREAHYSIFSRQGRNWIEHIGKSVSLSVGVTTLDVSAVSSERRGVIDGRRGLMLGGGTRVSEFLRINMGTLLSQVRVPYPLSDNFTLQANFYIGASIDIDLIGYFQRLSANQELKRQEAADTVTTTNK